MLKTWSYLEAAVCIMMFANVFLYTACTPSSMNPSLNPEKLEKNVSARVIYGPDSRQDLYQVIDAKIRQQSRSVAALVYATDLTDLNQDEVRLISAPLSQSYNLCSTESFLDQMNPAYCTGFLVDNQTLATAGHCVLNYQECANTKFVFGFSIDTVGQDYMTRPKADIYECKELIHTESRGFGSDFALIRLDRPVSHRQPLALRKKGQVGKHDLSLMIGHALGLPLKVSSGRVLDIEPEYFSTSLDSFGGNSGAPVFNTIDGRVEGIFRGGEQDFVEQSGCLVSKKCTENVCQGEIVTSISEIIPYLN